MADRVAVMLMMMLMLLGFLAQRVRGSSDGAASAPSYDLLEEYTGSQADGKLTVSHAARFHPAWPHRDHTRRLATGHRQLSNCAGAPCQNDGLCRETAEHKWRCECRHGFTGELCTELAASLACGHDRMRVSVPAAFLAWRGWHPAALRLVRGRCRAAGAGEEPRGDYGEPRAMLSLSVDDSSGPCGTSVQHNDSHVWFSNAVLVEREDGAAAVAIVNFTCVYGLDTLVHLPFAVVPTLNTLTVRGKPGSFHVAMRAFVRASFSEDDLYRDSDAVMAGTRLYLELRLAAPAGSPFYIFSRDCWATAESDPDSQPQHPLVQQGCPNEPEVRMHGANGNSSTVRFSLLAFRFVSEAQRRRERQRGAAPLPDVYLHCVVRVCVRAAAAAELCAANCSRSRRTERAGAPPTSPLLGGPPSLPLLEGLVSFGPIRMAEPDVAPGVGLDGGHGAFALQVVVLLAVAGSALSVVMLMAGAVALWSRRRQRRQRRQCGPPATPTA